MIKRHEIQATDDLVKYFNAICAAVDNMLATTQSEDVFGNPLSINIGPLSQ